MYEGTWDSVRTHQVPAWYDDAKLGVFLHWGLYSVPGWAPRVPDIQQLLIKDGPKRMLRENPYAEWYLNSMQITGSPTAAAPRPGLRGRLPLRQLRHDLRRRARPAPTSTRWRTCASPPVRATSCSRPSTTTASRCGPRHVPHPVKGRYHARRDLVGDLAEAVRARRMRMGLYYSGGYDWPYNDAVLRAGRPTPCWPPRTAPPTCDYVTAHVRELIDRYQPSVLVERHRVAAATAACPSSSRTTTTRSTTASSTTAGANPTARNG